MGPTSTHNTVGELRRASENDHEGIAELLLEKDVDINADDGWWGTALQRASQRDHVVIVRLLLANGAAVNAQDEIRGTALQRSTTKQS